MKVAFLLGAFPAISETFILDQITGLIDRKVDIDIYAIHCGSDAIRHPDHERYHLYNKINYQNKIFSYFPSIFFPKLPRRSKAKMNTLRTVRYRVQLIGLKYFYKLFPVVENKYDIIHAHFGPHGVRAQFFRDIKALDGKLVTSFHGYDMTSFVRQSGTPVYKELFKSGDLFLPISNFWKEQLITWGCDDTKIKVQHMGIKLDTFTFNLKPINSNKTIRLISVARLTEKKGLEYSIRAVAKLVQKNIKISYSIIGAGPLEQNLLVLINDLGIKQNVYLRGQKNRDEVIGLLQDADIFLAPSVTANNGDMEGIPMALMEAMAMGLPVISTFHSGISELIEDGQTGFLTKEKDVNAIADKLLYVIHNSKRLDEIKKNARNHVNTHFNLDKQNDELLSIYHNLFSK